jgi:hypothetical protein
MEDIDALPGRQYRFPKSMSSVLAGMVLQIDLDSGEADLVLGTAIERNERSSLQSQTAAYTRQFTIGQC